MHFAIPNEEFEENALFDNEENNINLSLRIIKTISDLKTTTPKSISNI